MEHDIKVKAYLTVEAAMVIPLIISLIVFLIYMMFYQYNRCLLEQDMGVLAIRSVALQKKEKSVVATSLQEEAAKLDGGKYLLWDMGELDISMEGYTIRIARIGGLVLSSGDYWSTQAAYESMQLNPVFLIRSFRKLTGGK